MYDDFQIKFLLPITNYNLFLIITVQFVLNTPPPRKYPALVKGRFPNVDFWIFQNPSTTDDFWSDALNTPPG